MVLQLNQLTFCWGKFYLRYQKIPQVSLWIEHSKLPHLKCSRGLLGVESTNPKIHMSICNQQRLLWHYFCFHSCPTMLVSCQSPWTCGARLSGTRVQAKTAVSREEMKVYLKQSLRTDILNPQALAVLTAVFYRINVSCVFRQLKVEAPCVTHNGCCSASRISVQVLAHLSRHRRTWRARFASQCKATHSGHAFFGWIWIELFQHKIAFCIVAGWLCPRLLLSAFHLNKGDKTNTQWAKLADGLWLTLLLSLKIGQLGHSIWSCFWDAAGEQLQIGVSAALLALF